MVTGVPMQVDARVVRRQAMGKRQVRRPNHRFNIISKPYQIQPIGIAPVLAGETLQHSLMQAQVWSDPLADGMKNIGWWCEYWGFYVKHTDLIGWDTDGQIGHEMVDMMLTDASLAAFQDADGIPPGSTTAWTYCYPGAIDYVYECLKSIVGSYFRDEGEQWDAALVDGVPIASMYPSGQSDAFDKLTMAANYADRSVSVPGDIGQLDDYMMHWLALRDAGLTAMDYDDWMRASGGSSQLDFDSSQSPRHHFPELCFYAREWSYAFNTVEPTTGVPSTAAGWRISRENKQRRYFPQPGWLILLNCIRPKVYLGTQQGAIAGAMQQRAQWLPAPQVQHHDLGHVSFADTAGPLANVMTAGYYIDVRDLLNFGDQFVNYATPASGVSGVPFVALPTVAGQHHYPAATQIMALFANTTTGRIRQDGVCSLSIATDNKQPPGQSLTLGHSTV